MRNIFYLLILTFLFLSCDEDIANRTVQSETPVLTQVSVIDALLQGFYDGFYPIGDLKLHGDYGIGTFHGLDGEMVIFNDTVFQVKADGNVYILNDTVKTPFAAVAPLIADTAFTFSGLRYDSLKSDFSDYFPTPNIFYLVKIKGEFSYMHTRSVPAQEKPYPPLVEVTQNQPEFTFENVKGDIIGFYCPAYAEGINVTGLHLHFIDESRGKGGHIIDFTLKSGTMQLGYLLDYRLILPDGGDFYGGDFTIDRTDELDDVEG
ncbi:MAG: acetolactate decarboxylase [Prolixibacteraceae bacterium]|jgi:acetolactate decarboxylase|nr:acetolactate decarboxylase [Prolixibacteraceae bacterium]